MRRAGLGDDAARRRARREFAVQFFPPFLIANVIYCERRRDFREKALDGAEGSARVVVPGRVCFWTRRRRLICISRGDRCPCNLNYLSMQVAPPRLFVGLPLPSPRRSAPSPLRLLSFFIQIPSRGIMKRPCTEREIAPLIFSTPRGDSKLIQREVSDDFDNDRRSANKHCIFGCDGQFRN